MIHKHPHNAIWFSVRVLFRVRDACESEWERDGKHLMSNPANYSWRPIVHQKFFLSLSCNTWMMPLWDYTLPPGGTPNNLIGRDDMPMTRNDMTTIRELTAASIAFHFPVFHWFPFGIPAFRCIVPFYSSIHLRVLDFILIGLITCFEQKDKNEPRRWWLSGQDSSSSRTLPQCRSFESKESFPGSTETNSSSRRIFSPVMRLTISMQQIVLDVRRCIRPVSQQHRQRFRMIRKCSIPR